MRTQRLNLGFGVLCTLLFVGLKLAGVVAWPWWLVFLPLTLSVLTSLVVVVFMAFVIWMILWI